MTADAPAIEVVDLRKVYPGGVRALDGLTFTVGTGELFALLGPNGAGKSTTVRILVTLTRPDSGRARVAGHDVEAEPQAVRRAIGYVAQHSAVDREATGRENLLLQGRLYHLPGRRLRARVEELLTSLGLGDAADRVARGYSGGMRRRLDIAMGIVHEPRVLFLDEPTTGLDPESRAALWRDLTDLRRRTGLTVLLTTHYLEEADALADRVAIVDRGRVVASGTPAALKAELGGDTVVLDVGAGVAAAVAHLLAGAPQVLEARAVGGSVHVRVADGARALPALMALVAGAPYEVRSATLSRPSLDEVYLHHTGRAFAQADAAGQDGGEGA